MLLVSSFTVLKLYSTPEAVGAGKSCSSLIAFEASEIDRDEVVKFVGGVVRERLACEDSRIVHDVVDRTEFRDGSPYDSVRCL